MAEFISNEKVNMIKRLSLNNAITYMYKLKLRFLSKDIFLYKKIYLLMLIKDFRII